MWRCAYFQPLCHTLRVAGQFGTPSIRNSLHRQFAKRSKAKDAAIAGDRTSAINHVVKHVESTFGKGSLMRLSAATATSIDPADVVPSGSLGLDIALGIGGLPLGRVVELFGPESSGKTTLTLHVIAEAQKKGLTTCFIDAEHALDPVYAQKLGVNLSDLLLSQPDSGEQALEICDTLVQSGAVDVIIIDSVAALAPRAELEGEMGASHIGLQARLLSQAMRKLTHSLHEKNTLLIFINQIRMKIGVLFGNPETTSGGNALKFYSSVRLEIRRTGYVKKGADISGISVRVKTVKNKLYPPFRSALFDIDFGKGISRSGELVDLGTSLGLLQKSGAWYSWGDRQLGQGREKTKLLLEEDASLADALEAAIREGLQKSGGNFVMTSEEENVESDAVVEVAEAEEAVSAGK